MQWHAGVWHLFDRVWHNCLLYDWLCLLLVSVNTGQMVSSWISEEGRRLLIPSPLWCCHYLGFGRVWALFSISCTVCVCVCVYFCHGSCQRALPTAERLSSYVLNSLKLKWAHSLSLPLQQPRTSSGVCLQDLQVHCARFWQWKRMVLFFSWELL